MVAVVVLTAACGGGPRPNAIPTPAPAPSETAERAPKPVLPATPSHAGPRDSAISDEDLSELWTRQLMVPVEGVTRAQLRDNYTAGRATGRIHGALDILAPQGTAILAPSDQVIGRLGEGSVGGIFIYAHDADGRFVYYYAHLERYRRGLAVGDRVAKGSVIGYVGTTGNAPKNTPHLHFQVMKRGAGRAWWDGSPINPFTYFAADGNRP
ncbi:MAG: peptidoglycan DD-metalloendopeptidase family protein [Gemmatimonadaceae bacterium]|nr:peptidoglycan DD-metalloendopeptidase family protein [Gemmatimonadaceae bacterium]